MKLIELEPEYKLSNPDGSLVTVNSLEEANCILFLCPVCYKNNNGPEGTHSILIPNNKTPDGLQINHPRWNMIGSSFEDLTVNPSISLKAGCNAHFFIKNGNIE